MTNENSAGTKDLGLHFLVLRCQTGDEQAFARLFERFRPRTLAHLKSLVGEDAEDVQQEVWLTVYRNLGSLSNPCIPDVVVSNNAKQSNRFLAQKKT
jgi:RNA polymerase sigma-70 factor (ECF subfamily)